ncbi:5-formyltetrahydrofolate cyclo-ligase [Citrus sinensis]|nr:5-formyltetrahydrofolate cyclo-ligase [Citrus sinensis]
MSQSNDSSNPEEKEHDLESIFQQKRILRSQVRKTLKFMDPSLRSHEDNAIQKIVLEAPWFKSSQRLCAYISCSALREVDTSKLLSQILQIPNADGDTKTRKKLYVPRVEDKNSHMRMFHISSIDDLIANSMNILEPAPVDADGNEREDVALSYSLQIMDEGIISATPKDMPVDALVSPSGVIPISAAALDRCA